MFDRPPAPDRWDALAVATAVGLLVLTHVVYPHRLLGYGAWLAAFSIWMAWFVYYGTKWLYGLEG